VTSPAPDRSDRRALAAEVASIEWFHRIDLGHGLVTPGASDPGRVLLPRLGLPERLDGRSVLDVGAWDGFFSFEAERRGAARVVATDSFSWSGGGWGSKAGFELARQALGSHVEGVDVDVMDLSPALGTFDLVLFLGVLYHLRDPIGAIERVAAVTASQLVLETEVRFDWVPWPAARVFLGRELNDDPTNVFAFNARALSRLLSDVGFTRVRVHGRTSQLRRAARVTAHRLRDGGPASRYASRRIVIHAWK
jgi:tRNA (mo5U34)-methyltransferase